MEVESLFCPTCGCETEHIDGICEFDMGPCEQCGDPMHGEEEAHVDEEGDKLYCTDCHCDGWSGNESMGIVKMTSSGVIRLGELKPGLWIAYYDAHDGSVTDKEVGFGTSIPECKAAADRYEGA